MSGNTYFVQNNLWNSPDGSQCIQVSGSAMSITSRSHNVGTSGPPASYPSFVRGCHYGDCTTSSNMPRQVSAIGSVPTRFEITPASGTWNASYDVWFDPTPRTNGSNTGLELMIWMNYSGSVQPIGSRTVSSVAIAGASWEVWEGHNGYSNVISYRRIGGTNGMTFDLKAFMNHAQSRGRLTASWYMTSIQAGFEVWTGGAGLRVNAFSAEAR
jgi:hypothetical protein